MLTGEMTLNDACKVAQKMMKLCKESLCLTQSTEIESKEATHVLFSTNPGRLP